MRIRFSVCQTAFFGLVPAVAVLLLGCDTTSADGAQLAALGDQASMFLQALLRQLLAAYLF